MRRKILVSLCFCTLFLICTTFVFYKFHNKGISIGNFLKEGINEDSDEAGEEQGIDGAIKYLASMRNNQETGTIDYYDVNNALTQVAGLPSVKDNSVNWKSMGPDNVGGRTRAILIDRKDPNHLYAGGVSGGLWESRTAGSSWVQIPMQGGVYNNISVTCITQDLQDSIYVGTGEGLAYPDGGGNNTGFLGRGIYKSYVSDGVIKFKLLASTVPSGINDKTSSPWAYVNKMAVNPVNGWIFAATGYPNTSFTQGGLMRSTDNGKTWQNAVKYPLSASYVKTATDIKVSNDGTMVASVGNQCFVSVNNGSTFAIKNKGGFPASTLITRVEFSISPTNSNYIYALAAKNTPSPDTYNTNGKLLNVYRSTDKGNNWTIIGPGGSTTFEIFGTGSAKGQGFYDNVIAVFPNDTNHILAAGVTMYEWRKNSTWVNRTNGVSYPIHADIHTIVFNPQNSNIFYIGCDGGIYKTIDGGKTFNDINLNYNVTQFYAMSVLGLSQPNLQTLPVPALHEEVMGGTQDNGTQWINHIYNTDQGAQQVGGGDGGWCSFSLINPDALFITLYYANSLRNPNKNSKYSWQVPADWYGGGFVKNSNSKNWGMLGEGKDNNGDGKPEWFPAPFVTPLLLWETFNDLYSKDYTNFIADKAYKKGDEVTVRSNNNLFPFYQILPKSLNKGDTLKFIDKISTRYFSCWKNEIWMTKSAVNFTGVSKWFKIANITIPLDTCRTLAITKDGNTLFVGTENGSIYRISNIRFAYDSLTAYYKSPYCLLSTSRINLNKAKRMVTSVATDPQNSEHIIVTLGNYGNTDYIYESTNALDSLPTFTLKQGNLPLMPVYSALIEMTNPKVVYVGTEYGVYRTSDITHNPVVWQDANIGMDKVPTFMLLQQIYKYDGDFAPTGVVNQYVDIRNNRSQQNVNNYGYIYAATHGRGIFKDSTNRTTLGVKELSSKNSKPGLNVYQNPVGTNLNVNFYLPVQSNVELTIYDLNGRKYRTLSLNNSSFGQNNVSIDISNLVKGAYIISLFDGKESVSSKFIK